LAESVTEIVKENVPADLGVPVILPVAAFKVRPGGNPALTAQWYGLVPSTAERLAE
jgi:hypothetical protein